MTGSEIVAVVGACSFIVGLITFLVTYLSMREKKGEKQGEMATNIKYIKERVDELVDTNKETQHEIVALGQRVTAVEESSKQAHKRIDELVRNAS